SRKTLDLALSILGNCCTERETLDIMRRQVALMSIQNRAARVLGNLATDPESSALIHAAGEGGPGFECAQSAARALLYLCDTPAHRLSLLLQGAFTSLAPLLSPDLPFGLRHSALRALHELTRGCGLECARQVVRSGVLPQLGALASKDKEEEVEEEEEKTMEELALKTLANVCAQGCLRPLVGSLGVIRRFCEEVKKDALKSSVFFKALCLCCKEAVNRAKVKDCGGLELITGFITTHQDHPLSRMAIWACVDFVFDEVAMETLQEAGLVAALVEWLVRLCKGSQLPPGDVARDCMDSFDFPPPEEKKEALCSNSFLSLSSPKTPVSPSKFKLGSPQRRKERDRGSILKFPIETPPSVTRPASYHPYHPEPWTPESPILLLLSRFSHVSDPSAVLVNSTVMSGLLLYLTSHPDPSARCFRLLLRLSENPNCLQALVRSGAAAMMHYQLCRRGVEGQGTRGEEEDKEKDDLLSNLQLQSEGAFGAGVLSHLLLTGSESDRLHSALCLPLNKALLKKLLLDGGGLQFALQPLGGDTEDDSPKCPLLYLPLLAGCLTALTSGLNPFSQSSFSQTNLDFAQISSPPIKKPRLAPPSCPYLTATFDLSFLLDSGETLSANRNAVSGEDSSSEYFQALLNGGFDEASSKDAIPIRDISAAMLAPALHHLHGCRFIATAIDKCHTLDSLVSSEMSENDKRFEETDLGRAMIGACRFLVTDLQKELEEVCIGLLTSGLDHLEKDKSEISHSEINASPDSKPQKRKCTNKTSPNRQADSWILNRLPQMYWFSQRYSYSNLGRACLSVLMVAPFSQAQVAEGLRSLVQEADCVQTLKMDLVRLVTEVLSCKG
uniref:BTB domain-containing protein n=1 Tax=Periophthalmus magnuspinnatus TaxID=409849 RepID=A0A3B3ZU02_9GOBI